MKGACSLAHTLSPHMSGQPLSCVRLHASGPVLGRNTHLMPKHPRNDTHTSLQDTNTHEGHTRAAAQLRLFSIRATALGRLRPRPRLAV
jgi:hypothetical protein